MLNVKKGKLETFLVLHNECLMGIKLNRHSGFDSLICCKTNKTIWTNVSIGGDLNLILDKVCLSIYP